jgi:Na+/phosphate symporter
MSWRGMLRPGMRAYLFPLGAGLALASSAFLPWIIVGDDISLPGVPDTAALWIVGLGAAAVLLATLSKITRKNSRHPLLLVGLVALGIMFLSWRIMPRAVSSRALTRSQAVAIVDDAPVGEVPVVAVGYGMYIGLIASIVLVAFGLTIVIKRASRPYVEAGAADDDVE